MALTRNPPVTRQPAFVLSEPLGFVTLYLDDLEILLSYLRANSADVILSAGSAIADEVDDLKSASSEELKRVAIRTVSPAMTVWLSSSNAEVLTTEQSDKAQKLTTGTAALLREHRGGGLRSFGRSLITGGFVGLLLMAGAIVGMITSETSSVIGLVFLGFGVSIALGLATLLWISTKKTGRGRIRLLRRSEARAAASTLRVQWAIAITAVLVGVLATLIATKLWGN